MPNSPFGHGGVGALDASIEMLQVHVLFSLR